MISDKISSSLKSDKELHGVSIASREIEIFSKQASDVQFPKNEDSESRKSVKIETPKERSNFSQMKISP